MRRDMNLESWRVFARVAKNGSINSSVEELGIDAPGISRIISSLEKAIGTALFDRTSHPMVLTDNGRDALETAQQMLSEHDSLLMRLHTKTDDMAGDIRVGVPPALLESYLVPFLVDFSKRYPEVHLEVTEYRAGLPIDFTSRTGLLDVVISYGPDNTHKNYVQIHYGAGSFVPCASPTYLARYGTPKAPEDLAEHIGVIFHSSIRSSATSLTRDNLTVPLHFKREVAFNSAESAKSATLIGAGINPGIAELHCYREIQSGALVRLFPGWYGLTEKLYIYTRPEILRLRRVRTFINEYRSAIAELFEEQNKVLAAFRN